MSEFTDTLTITEVDARLELWRLEEPLTYHLFYKRVDDSVLAEYPITVPKGYVSDGASVPVLLEKILPRWGKYRRPAIIHDYLCSRLRVLKPHPYAPDRKTADKIFLDAMKVVGVGFFTRYFMYIGVRVGAILGPLLPKVFGSSVVRNNEYFVYDGE